MRLTKTAVESLPVPASGQALYWDDTVKGFGVRVTSTGARSYIAQGRVNGKNRRVTIGQHGRLTCDEARKKAKSALVSLDDGIDPQEEKKRAAALSVTLRKVADVYCKERRTAKGGELTERSKADILYHVTKSFSDWADKPISGITRALCSEKFGELSEKSPAQANQAFRNLRALMNFAREAYRSEDDTAILPENPVSVLSGKKMWNADKAKNSYIPLDKVGAVWNFIEKSRTEDPLQSKRTEADIVMFWLLTGARKNEAMELIWDRVNLEAGTWHLPDPKNHNPVTLPLPAPLRSMLEARKPVDTKKGEYVFPANTSRSKLGHVSTTRDTLAKVSVAAGQSISAHDLRRTFRAVAGKCGIELWKTKLLMNHASADVTITNYTEKQDLRYLAPEAEQISAWIVQQGAIAAAGNVLQFKQENRA